MWNEVREERARRERKLLEWIFGGPVTVDWHVNEGVLERWWCYVVNGKQVTPYFETLSGPSAWAFSYILQGARPPRMFNRFAGRYKC